MRNIIRLFLFVSLFACVPFSQANTGLEQQRLLYAQAKKAMDTGNPSVYLSNQKKLRSYPLTPYLTLAELKLRLAKSHTDEVEKFLLEHGDLPQIRMFKLEWLRMLAKQGNWTVFVKHYSPELNLVELDCWFAQAQLQQGQQQAAFQTAEKLWLSSESRPNACDPVFDAWNKAGLRTANKVWARLALAVEARNYGLAKFLSKEHPNSAKAQLFIDVAQKPSLIKDKQKFAERSKENNAIVSIGLRRLFREEADNTLELLTHYGKQLNFSNEEKAKVARDIGVILAKRFDPRALEVIRDWDPQLTDELVAQWNARLLLRIGKWNEAEQSISSLSTELADTNRWRYWQIRSKQITRPLEPAPVSEFQSLAKERDFYGFMAADRSKSSYSLNNMPVNVPPKTLSKVRNSKAIQRAYELHALGDFAASQREWQHASRLFSQEELQAQAKLAIELDWFNPAIRTLAQAQYWDDLDIRFPLAYQANLVSAAQQQGIHPSWAYAITRQESAFMPTVRSHAGAMGLMQLMPGTAKETARRYNIPLSSPQQALNPDTNIQLGTAYLNQMMKQFNGNRILATAAYNAGPGRVRQWLKNAEYLPYDVWIETIPFDETRQYVQNVLTYSVIYGEKLQTPTPLVEWHEQLFEE